ncbi:hypothetical protein P7K49_020825 [Saguinus oedipus]|uniref:Uncharacterized protein n=1 Tax=Saguinus oedipus TaxID=9490 RepID=A0ABQ9UQZ1_SAGOE|nr:hypothetical protein P7K49_020825 [Saguinus oedipus]
MAEPRYLSLTFELLPWDSIPILVLEHQSTLRHCAMPGGLSLMFLSLISQTGIQRLSSLLDEANREGLQVDTEAGPTGGEERGWREFSSERKAGLLQGDECSQLEEKNIDETPTRLTEELTVLSVTSG